MVVSIGYITIVDVNDGADAIVAVLSNEAHTVPTDSAGNNGVFTGANTTMTIYNGTADDSANWTVTASASSVTGTLSGKTYTVTGLSADAGYVDLTASRSGYASIVKRFVLTKSKAGPAGSTGAQGPAGPAVVVTANRALSFTATDGALDGSQANIVLTAAVSGIASPTYAWTFSGLQTNPTASTTSSQTITAAQFGTSKSATVTCTVNGTYKDQVTIVRLEKSTAAPWATAGSTLGTDLSRWEIGSQTLVTVSDGKVGSSALRLSVGGDYPTQTSFVPIDPTKKYRVRFWARPSSTCNGLLYFSLRQAINETGSWGPVNGGRAPYKPSAQTRAAHNATYGTDAWGEYSYIWDAADWQAGVKFFRPEFLDNYGGTAGYWDVQGLVIEEATDVEAAKDAASAAQVAANTANAVLADIAADNKLTPAEKKSVRKEWDAIYAERAGIRAQADSFGITTEKTNYDNDFQALGTYLNGGTAYTIGATPPSWITDANLSTTTTIVGTTFRANWSNLYADRQALLNKISAEAAKKADWASVSGSGKPENGATVGANSSNLRAGVGVNMVFNGDYTDGLAGTVVGWRSAGNQPSLGWNLPGYIVQGEGTAYIIQPGTNGTAVFDAHICNGKGDQRFAVTPGQRYEFYAYLNVHRCIGHVILMFMDAAGNHLWAVDGTSVSHGSTISSIGDMRMSHVFAVAPANAVKALLIVRGAGINSYDPYVFFSRVYFGEAGAGQTEPSPWSPGRGISQITSSNVTTYIENTAIGAAQIGSINLVGTSNFAVKTATSGARMDMDSRRIKVFDENDVLRVQLGDLTV